MLYIYYMNAVTNNRQKTYRIPMENFELALDSLLNSLLNIEAENDEDELIDDYFGS